LLLARFDAKVLSEEFGTPGQCCEARPMPLCGRVASDARGGDAVSEDIKPRVTQAGDELCDYVESCPQRSQTIGCDYCANEENYCKLLDEWVVDETICPVAARRNAALLRECRMMFNVVLDQEGFHMGNCLDDDIRALLERIGE
jgi:hypothetical protein